MQNLAQTIEQNPLPQDKEELKNIFMVLESFIYVLGKWQKDIACGNTYSFMKFDISIISDINTISNMWTQKDSDDSEVDLGDIFDF